MADPAFDAFSQGRNTGTQDRVTERRRVDTYTDPNRYQMPPRRRLGVHAQNKSMFVTPEKPEITAFAEGLAKVQPQIMDYLTSKQAVENQKQIEYGKLDAMGIAAAEAGDTEFVDDQWREFGYKQQKALLAGERLSAQFTHDAATRDLRGDSFSRWANKWWKKANEENPQLATMDPEVMETFYKPFNKAAIAAKNKDMIEVDKLKTRDQYDTASEFIYKEFQELYKNNPYYTPDEAWVAMKKDLTYLNRLTHEQQDDIKVASLIRIAVENSDLNALAPLERKALGVDSSKGYEEIIEMPQALSQKGRYREQIIEARETIAKNKADAESARKTKEAADKKVYTEFQRKGHHEITMFVGFDPAIRNSLQPAAAAIAAQDDEIAKKEFTRRYDLKLANKVAPEQAMKEAVEETKDHLSGLQSRAHFEAQEKHARWLKERDYRMTTLVSTPKGRYQIAKVFDEEGVQGFEKMFGSLNQRQINDLEAVAAGYTADEEIKARRATQDAESKLADRAKTGREKVDQNIKGATYRWTDRSEQFNAKFEELKATNPKAVDMTDEEIYQQMMLHPKYSKL